MNIKSYKNDTKRRNGKKKDMKYLRSRFMMVSTKWASIWRALVALIKNKKWRLSLDYTEWSGCLDFQLGQRSVILLKLGESDRRIIGRKKETKVNPTPISRHWKDEENLEEKQEGDWKKKGRERTAFAIINGKSKINGTRWSHKLDYSSRLASLPSRQSRSIFMCCT